jgi:protein-glutamine gamma-glutamyltransferase
MITISGAPIRPQELNSQLSLNKIQKAIIDKMALSQSTFDYSTLHELHYELKLRKAIIKAARDLNRNGVTFSTFNKSRGNPHFWKVNETGMFNLKSGVSPSDAINNIFLNGSQYAFECATAMVAIYYKAVLDTMPEATFNHLFAQLQLYSWNFDPDLGLYNLNTTDVLPGDVIYFDNPDVDPKTIEWQGENAVVLGDGTYFGHGIGIKNADQMIAALNKHRKSGATQSAFLMDQVTRPNFKKLANYATPQPATMLRTPWVNKDDKILFFFRKNYFGESISLEEFSSMLMRIETKSVKIRIGKVTYKMC